MKKIALLAAVMLLMPTVSHASKSYKTKRGETLASVAAKFHTSTRELKSINGVARNKLAKGTTLIIPVGTESEKTPRNTKTIASVYQVKKGDTLPKIAKRTGVPMAEIRKLNAIKGNRVKVGQTLALRAKQEEIPAQHKAPATFKTIASLDINARNSAIHDDTEVREDLEVEFGVTSPENGGNPKIKALQRNAYSLLGTHYVFGGNTLSGLDCSSFVQHVFQKMNIEMPRTAREQFTVGNVVSPGDLQKGDLVFFQTYATFPSHVGIYLGDNKMIHASSRNKRVIVSTFGTPYYLSRFLGAKRIAQINPRQFDLSDLTADTELEGQENALDEEIPGVNLSSL